MQCKKSQLADTFLHQLSWGLPGGRPLQPFKQHGGAAQATVAASKQTFFHRPSPKKDLKTLWGANWRYYVEHRRRLRSLLPPDQWLIVSQREVMLHHSDHSLMVEALKRNYWPGAFPVNTG